MRTKLDDDDPYPDSWAYTFIGMIDPGEGGRLYRLHMDVQFEYRMAALERWLMEKVREVSVR